jgi:S-DNA-T family DNA segregation ATPase FtsK/SpoIIIE
MIRATIRLAGVILLLLFFFLPASTLIAQQLSDQQQSGLDGRYAGIRQKRINALRRAGAQRTMPMDKVNKEIQDETRYIEGLRNRWRTTKYAANFERNFQIEMQVTTFGGGRPQVEDPPFKLSLFAKLVIVVLGYWICRKLWNAPLGKVRTLPPTVTVNPNEPIELNESEKAKIREAQEKSSARQKELTSGLADWQKYSGKLASNAAGLALRCGAFADQLSTSAVSGLNLAVPDYRAYLASMEKNFLVALAPWNSDLWNEFIRQPKAEVLNHVCYAHIDEASLLQGETGINSPRTVALLASKGPVIVRCDHATKTLSRNALQNLVLRAALASPAETRFALIDPYGLGAAFPMRGLLPRVRTSARTPADELAEVVDDIRRINEAVVGQAESFASLTREKRGGEVFEIVVALDYPRAYERDPRALEYLARIAQSGPRAGRHLILEWDGGPAQSELTKFENHELIDVIAANASPNLKIDPVAPAELQRTLLGAVAAVKSKPTGGDWNSQVRPTERLFAESSARMVETTVGERLRIWFGDSQDGKPCAHAMLAGQTGSGKSFLLHVFITGLAARYSPNELKLVLVDGKQGVEFENYRNLPHAQVVCLRTSPAVARSVLEDFIAEMEDRYVKFQKEGVSKLEDYRRKTGIVMPRMLMIVDEYQQLLDGDPDRGAQMLSRVLEKGRAAGTHLLLGSQTFEVRGLPASAMTHVHLRAALSLPIDYIQAVTAFGPEGKKLIRDLSPSGQVVINDESGRDGANARGTVARLDATAGCALPQVVMEITQAANAATPGMKPVVLSGNDAATLAENPFVRRWVAGPPDAAGLQAVARQSLRDGGFGIASWSAADRPVPLWLGRKFDVHGHLLAALRRAPGHNLLSLGSESTVRLGMLANALSGLRAMMPLAGSEVLVLDGLSEGQPGAGMLAVAAVVLRSAGALVQIATPVNGGEALEQFSSSAVQPRRNPDTIRLIVLSEPEYFPALAAPSGFGPPPPGPSRTFKEYLRNGPPLGSHAIVTASGMGSLSTVIHPSRDAAMFNHRVVQQSNEEESMTLFSSLAATRIMAQTDHHMAAMYVDTVQGVRAAQLFKAYSANSNLYGDQSPAGLATAMRNLFRGAGGGA